MTTIQPSAGEGGDALAELHRALDTETTFMLAEPGERGSDLPDQSYRFVADDGGRLVGVVDVFALRWRRAQGRGAIVLGVRASHQGRGVGRVIHPGMRTLTDWLAESGAAALRALLATS